jgi:hypothetical protein
MNNAEAGRESNLTILSRYIPEKAAHLLLKYIEQHKLLIKIKNSRATKLGDYRPLRNSKWDHQITINHDLNPYAFLITMVHELAHMQVQIKYNFRQKPHGARWKVIYAKMLSEFLHSDIFPQDVLEALKIHLDNPTASSCTDHRLHAVLRKFDPTDSLKVSLSTLEHGSRFRWHNGKVFIKSQRLRTRFRCEEVPGGRIYLFHPLAEVELID